jgi:UDP-glucose 4-epimerase
MKFFVTGGAGFVGSHFVDSCLKRGHEVICFDNLSTGRELFLEEARQSPKFQLIRGDITALGELSAAMAKGTDWVAHFAANADVRGGTLHPRKDLEVNTIGTWNVLEAARLNGTRKVLFSSTGSVYGEPVVFPTPEDAPFPEQTSLYGASKLAGEAMMSAYCHGFGFDAAVFRMVSVLGPRYTHGHVFDFVKSLTADPSTLKVLGDGGQTKSYLHISDLIEAFWLVITKSLTGFHVHNVGHAEFLTVRKSVQLITSQLRLNPEVVYAGGTRGWVGDSPRIQLEVSRLHSLGWAPRNALEDAVRETVDYLVARPSLLRTTP